jgi:ribosomal protein L11 methyltransferase (prmA)
MQDKFYELSLKTTAFYDEILELLFELGVTCIEEKDGEIIVRDEDDLSQIEWGAREYAAKLSEITGTANDLLTKICERENKDWIDEYKKAVQPILLDKIYVRPSWEAPKKGAIDIIIDPALAFGSGHHESTSSCILFLQKYAKSGCSALDVGCGSGILSIALAKLGCIVDACDTDDQATQSASANAELNGVKFNKIWTGSIANLRQKYDIVVANIIADVIFMLANDLKRALKDGAVLVLSGILEKYQDRVEDTFKELKLVEKKQLNDWMSYVFMKI